MHQNQSSDHKNRNWIEMSQQQQICVVKVGNKKVVAAETIVGIGNNKMYFQLSWLLQNQSKQKGSGSWNDR